MKCKALFFSTLALLMLSGCKDDEARLTEQNSKPTFMFWCFRKEIVSADYHIPDMKTSAAAAYIQNRLKAIPGYVSSSVDLPARTMTVKYQSSTIRKMNFEEAIARAGFAVNNRPANPHVKLPAGVQ
ncbi:heavy-metal-associated domain-containing protein [Verrucomicrobia bacterium S94]|nr:heavy-metal-associated domain-containing protein [Verrucomicrobia bacterium S94]